MLPCFFVFLLNRRVGMKSIVRTHKNWITNIDSCNFLCYRWVIRADSSKLVSQMSSYFIWIRLRLFSFYPWSCSRCVIVTIVFIARPSYRTRDEQLGSFGWTMLLLFFFHPKEIMNVEIHWYLFMSLRVDYFSRKGRKKGGKNTPHFQRRHLCQHVKFCTLDKYLIGIKCLFAIMLQWQKR